MPLLDLFWTTLWVFLFIAWFWLLISVIGDLFRSELSGGKKALWAILLIFLPVIGVFAYLIVHGGKMQERTLERAMARERQQQEYIRVSGTPSTADEIAKLAELHQRGVINDAEFTAQKAALLRTQPVEPAPHGRDAQPA